MRTSIALLFLAGALVPGCSNVETDDGSSDECPDAAPVDGASCHLPDMTECRYTDSSGCEVLFRCDPVYPEVGAPSEWVDIGRTSPSCGCSDELCDNPSDTIVETCPPGRTCYETSGCSGVILCMMPTVVGTTHDGECATAIDFATRCKDEGGVLGDNCQDTSCGGSGYRATCFAPPTAPGVDQFSCDGLFNCNAGEVCHVSNPVADGCFNHACEPPPAACAADSSCACLEANAGSSVLDCAEDADGNPTLTTLP